MLGLEGMEIEDTVDAKEQAGTSGRVQLPGGSKGGELMLDICFASGARRACGWRPKGR